MVWQICDKAYDNLSTTGITRAQSEWVDIEKGSEGKDMRKKYSDVTQKNIKVYIIPENDYVLGQHWSVRLGDIEVVDTTQE